MTDGKLQHLLDKYVGGGLNDEEKAELERTLLISPSARAQFWKHAHFHSQLARWGQESWGRRIAKPEPRKPILKLASAARNYPKQLLAIAAALTLFGAVTFHLMKTPEATLASNGVAVLATTVDAVWGAAGQKAADDQVLSPGNFNLESGLAQIEFFNGTRLLVEGPANFDIIDASRTYCHSGRLRLYVPPRATGFTVESQELTVVDIGTEFGIYVDVSGLPEVQVFQGLVKAHLPGSKSTPVSVRKGQAISVEEKTIQPIKFDPAAFADEQELNRRASESSKADFSSWRKSAETLSNDPATRYFLSFDDEQAWTRTVTNRAKNTNPIASRADIIGCQWTEGRWPGKRAIHLNGSGDRLRIEVPEPIHEFTLFASVRIDFLPNDYQALIAPDVNVLGAIRWGISGDGRLRLGHAISSDLPEPDWKVYMTGAVIKSTDLGQWITLATTCNAKEVRHYINGLPVSRADCSSSGDFKIGPAQIGNWNGNHPRYLPAAIDEFIILDRALSAEEIRAHNDSSRRTVH